MDPRYSRLDAQVVRESAKNRLFLEANKSILIQGDCVLCGFQNSKEIIIKGKCKKSNFDQISKSIQIDGNVSKCVFNSVGRIRIYGTAKNCSFIGIEEKNISISDGTGKGCTLDGAPLVIVSRSTRDVFSFGAGPKFLASSGGGSAPGRANAPREQVRRVQQPPRNDSGSGKGTKTKTVVTGEVLWGAVSLKGGVIMMPYTIDVMGSGTIGGVSVTQGRYAKRAGDDNLLFRQDLSADPMSSPWQVRVDGQWVETDLTPTLS